MKQINVFEELCKKYGLRTPFFTEGNVQENIYNYMQYYKTDVMEFAVENKSVRDGAVTLEYRILTNKSNSEAHACEAHAYVIETGKTLRDYHRITVFTVTAIFGAYEYTKSIHYFIFDNRFIRMEHEENDIRFYEICKLTKKMQQELGGKVWFYREEGEQFLKNHNLLSRLEKKRK